MRDTPRVDGLTRMVRDVDPFPIGRGHDQPYEAIPAANARQLERELAAVIARAKAECDRWKCNERWDGRDEYCPNCPYELVTRKD